MRVARRQLLSCGLEQRLLGRLACRRLHHRCQAVPRDRSRLSYRRRARGQLRGRHQ